MKKITESQLLDFKTNHSHFFKLPESFEEDFMLFFYSEFEGVISFLKKEYKGGFKNDKYPEATDRVLKHWENLQIISANRGMEKGWRIYSYLDQLWTSIVIYLRRFGYPLDKIKKIKEDYLSQLKEYVDSDYPLLALFFAYSHSSKDHAYLVIYDNGNAELTLRQDYIKVISDGIIADDHILINISSIMNHIEDTFPDKFNRKLGSEILSEKESKLIDVYRQEAVTEMTISKYSKPEKITYSSKSDPNSRALFKGLSAIEFGNMEVKKTDGKVVNVKITKTEEL